jgi:hypothetical protein
VPARHSVPLWEMETDYSLHNSPSDHHSFSMKSYERTFGLSNRQGDLSKDAPDSLELSRSEIAGRIRRKCDAQSGQLSLWWKVALQLYVQQRIWLRHGGEPDQSYLPTRYDRLYQPEKIAQFDRFFARGWAVPVRRPHSAQHTEGTDQESSKFYLRQAIAGDVEKECKESDESAVASNSIKLRDFFETHGFKTQYPAELRRFGKRLEIKPTNSTQYAGQPYSSDNAVPEEYLRYTQPFSEVSPLTHASRKDVVEEFQACLRDFTMDSNDVAGIRDVSTEQDLVWTSLLWVSFF